MNDPSEPEQAPIALWAAAIDADIVTPDREYLCEAVRADLSVLDAILGTDSSNEGIVHK